MQSRPASSRNNCRILPATRSGPRVARVVTDFSSVSRPMRAFAASIVETVRHPLLVLDAGLRVRAANSAFHTCFRVPSDRSESQAVFTLGDGFDLTDLHERLYRVATTGEMFEGFEVRHDFPGTGPKTWASRWGTWPARCRPCSAGGASARPSVTR